ncbi:MAG: hypothetical protein LBU76_07300 [Azoarcus sp.]|jgi:hypothetical protein|nr:hypothetical protein [Azoarcus sp.]
MKSQSRNTSVAVLATLLIAGSCFSTPALARSDRDTIRDILLAPLLLPAAIVAATAPRPVIYQETRYVAPQRHVVRHRYAPRHDVRRYERQRYNGRNYRRYR